MWDLVMLKNASTLRKEGISDSSCGLRINVVIFVNLFTQQMIKKSIEGLFSKG